VDFRERDLLAWVGLEVLAVRSQSGAEGDVADAASHIPS
jgi:hypothetical protein